MDSPGLTFLFLLRFAKLFFMEVLFQNHYQLNPGHIKNLLPLYSMWLCAGNPRPINPVLYYFTIDAPVDLK